MAFEDLRAQPMLKELDTPTHGGLLQAEFARSSPEAPPFGSYKSATQIAEIKRQIRHLQLRLIVLISEPSASAAVLADPSFADI